MVVMYGGSKTTTYNSSGSKVTTMPWTVGGTKYTLPSEEAYLNRYLNKTYYNSLSSDVQNIIVSHFFNIGAVPLLSSNALKTTVSYEKTYKWKGNVGLMNVSDYIKSNSNSSSCNTVYQTYSTTDCKETTWLAGSREWTIAPASAQSTDLGAAGLDDVWMVNLSGSVLIDNRASAVSTVAARPVFFLSSSITLSGSGTKSDPYIPN